MQRIKIEKRITEETASILKMADFLPAGKANALRNKLARINKWARKAQAMTDAPVGSLFTEPVHASYDARTDHDMAAQERCKKAVFLHMAAGGKVSLLDAPRFRVSQMHTTIAKIRKDIERKNLPYIMCDEWVRPKDTRPFKRYWLIDKPASDE
ncbi:MAG: hypothetical protein J6T17_02125 [Clostridia bacterium]|nr:hypothetical protein [Clostridia bacterium]